MSEKNAEKRTCKKCGKCCTYITIPFGCPEHIDPEDFKAWISGFKDHYDLFREPEGLMFIKIKNMRCMHLLQNADGTATCGIYDKRPKICREFTCW